MSLLSDAEEKKATSRHHALSSVSYQGSNLSQVCAHRARPCDGHARAVHHTDLLILGSQRDPRHPGSPTAVRVLREDLVERISENEGMTILRSSGQNVLPSPGRQRCPTVRAAVLRTSK
jgi:hypothetical protein